MAVRVDEAGQQRPSARVYAPVEGHDRRGSSAKNLDHLALVVDDEAAEAVDLAVGTDLNPPGILDQCRGNGG